MGSNIFAYSIRRIVAGVPVVLIVVFLTFALTYLTPGDAAVYLAGDDATPEQVQEVRSSLGLDRPFLEQFLTWLVGLFSGNLGNSLVLPQTVGEALLIRAEPTIMLALFAQVIAVALAVPLGVLAGKFYGGRFDRAVNVFAVAGIAVPPFVVGIGLILLLSVVLALFPATGYVRLEDGLLGSLGSLVMPAIALGLAQAAFIVRITRSTMKEVFSSDFILAATMRGFSEKRIVLKHVVRAGIGPTISAIGVSFATLINGAIVVEIVFNIPGLGRLLTSAVESRDVPILQGLLLVITVAYVLLNILTDVVQAAVNPKVSF
ncbi:ABC transporter permease [Arthrobacter sp. B1805]|uniref:ABC transporter permease n=1 Tax=Arthrobacter sp. B1805 TaxID=2058892 RepID=UPI000CE577F6|nr:ABC transporter permease [Arthrobacter sp. B1805]